MSDPGGLKSPSCPRSVLDLIERFELHRETYKRPGYNETQVRREFIDPMFKALGWDAHEPRIGNAHAVDEREGVGRIAFGTLVGLLERRDAAQIVERR
jgi:hypothetical protein